MRNFFLVMLVFLNLPVAAVAAESACDLLIELPEGWQLVEERRAALLAVHPQYGELLVSCRPNHYRTVDLERIAAEATARGELLRQRQALELTFADRAGGELQLDAMLYERLELVAGRRLETLVLEAVGREQMLQWLLLAPVGSALATESTEMSDRRALLVELAEATIVPLGTRRAISEVNYRRRLYLTLGAAALLLALTVAAAALWLRRGAGAPFRAAAFRPRRRADP